MKTENQNKFDYQLTDGLLYGRIDENIQTLEGSRKLRKFTDQNALNYFPVSSSLTEFPYHIGHNILAEIEGQLLDIELR